MRTWSLCAEYQIRCPCQSGLSVSSRCAKDLPTLVCLLRCKITSRTLKIVLSGRAGSVSWSFTACSTPKLIGVLPGLGQAYATTLTSLFALWCYITPIIGAVAADQYLGRYKTIMYSSIFYILGLLLLVWTTSPLATELGTPLTGLHIAMLLIGIGTGGIKANVNPLVAEQYKGTKPTVRNLAGGARLIVDPDMTIER